MRTGWFRKTLCWSGLSSPLPLIGTRKILLGPIDGPFVLGIHPLTRLRVPSPGVGYLNTGQVIRDQIQVERDPDYSGLTVSTDILSSFSLLFYWDSRGSSVRGGVGAIGRGPSILSLFPRCECPRIVMSHWVGSCGPRDNRKGGGVLSTLSSIPSRLSNGYISTTKKVWRSQRIRLYRRRSGYSDKINFKLFYCLGRGASVIGVKCTSRRCTNDMTRRVYLFHRHVLLS